MTTSSFSPTLVLNADYQPLSYFPLSLWSWQDTIKAVFLDRVNGKVTIDECADISVEINSILDVESIIKDPFRLEVSSAGIDRYLSSLDDFTKYKNHNVKVKSETYSGRGKLIAHSQNSLTLSNNNGETCLDLSRVLDIRIDLEGMSLESIKEMEFK